MILGRNVFGCYCDICSNATNQAMFFEPVIPPWVVDWWELLRDPACEEGKAAAESVDTEFDQCQIPCGGRVLAPGRQDRFLTVAVRTLALG